MTRAELSEDSSTWNIPGTRAKNKRPHVIPLPPLAREIVAGVKQIAGKPGYVFTTNGRTPVSGFSKTKKRLDIAMPAVPHWRVHDLRRTAATGMARAGADLHVIERALNHVSGSFGIEPTSRDTERPAQPSRRPDHPVLRDEGELHVDSFAK